MLTNYYTKSTKSEGFGLAPVQRILEHTLTSKNVNISLKCNILTNYNDQAIYVQFTNVILDQVILKKKYFHFSFLSLST